MAINNLSEKEKEQIIKELDKSSGMVHLYCVDHNYFGPDKGGRGLPTKGCSKCWLTFYHLAYANCPPHKRGEFLDNLEKTVHDLIQAEAKGKIDFRLFKHPQIEIEKDGIKEN